jgi:pimeloyl-ACP methyl ester carboxylesterase
MQSRSQIRFCSVGDGQRIAFAVQGNGPVVVLAPWCVSHLEHDIEEPKLRAFYERLSARYTLVRYDHTGVGLSDRARTDYSFERELDELHAVVKSVTHEPVALMGGSFGGPIATAFAARYPELVSRLVLYGTFSSGSQVAPPQVQKAMVGLMRAHWRLAAKTLTSILAPGLAEEEARRFTRSQIAAASPEAAAQLHELFYAMDVREIAKQVQAPTLVVHRLQDHSIPLEAGRDVAARIPGATMVTLEGQVHLPWFDGSGVLDAILEFISPDGTVEPAPAPADDAELIRSGDVWAIGWAGSRQHLKHAKGLADIATLVQHPGTGITALTLTDSAPESASDAERARKAVTARLRDAIARVRNVHPELGAHLDGAISTGLTCVYKPERPIRWKTS